MPTDLEWSLIAPAFGTGLLVLATHVPLGQRVLERGIVFIDIAVAQFAVLGAIAAHVLLDGAPPLATQAAALLAALAGALLLNHTEGRWPRYQEALIGSGFVVAASLGVLLLAGDPHGGEHLREALIGQILWTTPADLVPLAAVTAIVLAGWYGLGLRRSPVGFYLLFALAVTSSVQVIGIYLVFASLIIPALSTLGMRRHRTAAACALGAAGYLIGLLLSASFDLPAGATIVCACAVLALLLASVRGAMSRPDAG